MKSNAGSVFTLVISSLLIAGCVHAHKVEQPEAHSLGENERHAKIGSKEVEPGDRVELLKTTCKPGHIRPRGGPNLQECSSVVVGEAIVISVDGESSAVIRLDPGAEYSTDLKVEKKK